MEELRLRGCEVISCVIIHVVAEIVVWTGGPWYCSLVVLWVSVSMCPVESYGWMENVIEIEIWS